MITFSDDPAAIIPQLGAIRFNPATNTHEGWNGVSWNPFY